MGCALVISSLYPLYTLEGPPSGRHSMNIFLICIELPVPVFLQKTASLAPTSLETVEQMPTLSYFCSPLILHIKSYRNFLQISSPISLVDLQALTINLTSFTRACCRFFSQVC